MRRYTAIKSSVYAPTSTNVIQQHMLHCHMTYHYRMMYNAKSKVDSSPPRHYKGRSFPLTDCPRKKLKYPIRCNRKKATHQPEMELHNQLLIDRILYDTKLPPSAYIHECVTQREYMNESSLKELQSVNDFKIDSKDFCRCQNIDCVPSLNISSKKVKQVPQCRAVNQPWTKRASGNKWNSSHLKNLENSNGIVRNSITRQISKPRLYHPAQCRRTLFQGGENVNVSSGSEGNAGDDEDGVPTSSYDDSNPSDSEKHKLSGRKISSPDSGPLFKKAISKRQGEACPCIPVVERAKKVPASEISSRDSAYGGEGMSSTEKERATPDHMNDDGIFQCVGGHFSDVSKAESVSCLLPQEEPQLCFKSELYMKFLQDVTDDILVQGVYTNEGLERLFQEHINNNVYSLDKNHLQVMITKLGEDLGMPALHFEEDKLFEERNVKQLASPVKGKESTECIMESENQVPIVDAVEGKQFIPKPERVSESDVDNSQWAKKQVSCEEIKSAPSVVIIENNFSMSKKDILDNLVYLDFDESMAEEIYHILAGKGCTYPDFTLKELQEILQQ